MSRLGLLVGMLGYSKEVFDICNKFKIENQNNKIRFDSYKPHYNGKIIKQYSCRLKRDNILRK